MPRRSSRRRSRRPSRSGAGSATGPRPEDSGTLLRKRPVRRWKPTPLPEKRHTETLPGKRLTRDPMPDRLRVRRTTLLPRERAPGVIGLPPPVLRESRSREHASKDSTKPTACTRRKEERRSVIIATGHGGRNGVRDYKPRRKC